MKFLIGLQIVAGFMAVVIPVLIVMAVMDREWMSVTVLTINGAVFLVLFIFVIPNIKRTERIIDSWERSK